MIDKEGNFTFAGDIVVSGDIIKDIIVSRTIDKVLSDRATETLKEMSKDIDEGLTCLK